MVGRQWNNEHENGYIKEHTHTNTQIRGQSKKALEIESMAGSKRTRKKQASKQARKETGTEKAGSGLWMINFTNNILVPKVKLIK